MVTPIAASRVASTAKLVPLPLLTAVQKQRAEGLTSLFENGTPVLQYAFAQKLGDGRGVTAGRAGFTTATDDAKSVIERYTKVVAQNPLATFLPRLRQISALPEGSAGRSSTRGLEGFEAAWAQASKDPKFRAAQDAEVNTTYYQPSQRIADSLGLKTPLARAQLYDAIIQHGEGTDPDGLPSLVARANKAAGGSPAQGIDEKKWFSSFLAERRKDLTHAFDPATRAEWAASVDRVGVFEDLIKAGNWQLTGPIKVSHGDFQGTVP
jgi:chitosanase